MKLSLCLVLSLLCLVSVEPARAQQGFQVTRISPYDSAVPGQILNLEVEGLEGGAWPMMLRTEDFELTVSQDGVSQKAKIRTVSATLKSDPQPRTNLEAKVDAAAERKMRPFQSVGFVVPAGLHAGEAELTLAYRGQRGSPIKLTIVEKPLRPVIGSVAVMTLNSSALPPPGARVSGNNFGWRLERGSTARLTIQPLTDPDDPTSAILIRFKQGDQVHDAPTRVTNQAQRVENRNRSVGFFPARDFLEVDVPRALAIGEADVEIRVRANNQESETATLKATITDANASLEAPNANAPRVLMVSPMRVGAGQSLMLSLDYRRTLNPDPAKTVVVIEQGSARYFVPIERSSLKFGPAQPDAPVLFFLRTTAEIIGKAQIRVYNQLRAEPGGMSAPVPIEIVSEPLPPELIDVRESTAADLAPLRQKYELQNRAGRTFSEFDPNRKYVTLDIKGIDYNPNYVRITFEQAGKNFDLKPVDFSSYGEDRLIVRQPKELIGGATTITVENRGGDSYSVPVSKTFEICCKP